MSIRRWLRPDCRPRRPTLSNGDWPAGDTLAGKSHGGDLDCAGRKQMTTPGMGGDGLGVFLQGQGHAQRFWHNGRDEGFDTLMTACLEAGQRAL